jgi:predicted phage terminase large subunit-like protein
MSGNRPHSQAVGAILAQEDLYFFSRWMFLKRRQYHWRKNWHHKRICDALMRVFRGECRRLIINMPPRYSKTELAVVNFVSWCLGQVPDCEFIHVSYSASLAVNNSAAIRDLMAHEEYQAIFPGTELANDAKHHWKTTKGGVMYAAGAGGTLTGFGAGKDRDGFGGAIIIDDPHKADEARSDVVRQGVIDWFQNTLESRVNSPTKTPIILIMQRLHERDLAGWLLDGGNGEEWEHLCLPAIQPDGTALWPEKHGIERLRQMQDVAPYTFSGQYQQTPTPGDGGLFKPDAIQTVDEIPWGTHHFVRGWDLGASVDGDPTAGGKLAVLPDGRYLIADMVKMAGPPHEVEQCLKNTADRDGKGSRQSIPQDPGQAGKAQIAYLTRILAGHAVISSPETGDKITRAEPFAAQVNAGNVAMLRAPWNDALIAELRAFPNGAHDDQVDALSRAFGELINTVGGGGFLGAYGR